MNPISVHAEKQDMKQLRHLHRSMGLIYKPDRDGECAVCGENFRHPIHLRMEERRETWVATKGAEYILNCEQKNADTVDDAPKPSGQSHQWPNPRVTS